MPLTILCVDDDRAILDELRRSLGGQADLIHCTDLDEAMEIAICEEPDLVLLETRLAAGDGLDLAEQLRGHAGDVSAIPIVVVTSTSRTPSIYGRAMQLGVADYLTKPVHPEELAACVRDQTERKRKATYDANAGSGVHIGIGSGKLADLPVPELLDRVHRRGESGVLIVGDARKRVGIQIRNGSPTAVTQPRGENLDDFLVRTDRLSAEDRDRALNEASLGLSEVEEILLGMGVLDEETLDTVLDEWAEEVILGLFELPSGRYRFEPGRQLKGIRSLEVTRSAHSLIARGILGSAPMERIGVWLARYADLYVAAAASPEPVAADVPFSDAQREFIPALMGDRTVGDLLDGSEFEQRTLYAFAILGAIDLLPDPSLVLDDAIEEERVGHELLPDVEHAPETALEAVDESHAGSDFSFEDDLFEARAFEDDSFEMEMVAELPLGEPPDLIEIDELVSAQLDPLVDEPAAAPSEPSPGKATALEARKEPRKKTEKKPKKEAKEKPKKEAKEEPKKEAAKAKRPATKAAKPERASEPVPAKQKSERKKKKKKKKAEKKIEPQRDLDLETQAKESPEPAPEPAAPSEAAAAEPKASTEGELALLEPEPAGPRHAPLPRPRGNPYEIAPLGHVRTSPEERVLVVARVQNRTARKYKHLLDRQSEALTGDMAHGSESRASEAERSLEAESWFRKGRERLKSKHYDRAAEAFGMSSHLDPNEGEYVAHLGYTLYLLSPNDECVRKEALEDIARGIKLSPEREIPYIFLGRIFKVKGDIHDAMRMFQRAVEIRPHCREAVQEIRLIQMRENKKASGLLGRFRK